MMSEESVVDRDAVGDRTSDAPEVATEGDRTRVPWWQRALQRLAQFTVSLIYFVSIVVAIVWTKAALKAAGVDLPGLLAILLVLSGFMAAVAIHEAGHALAARAVGLTPVRARWLEFEFIRRRRGWSVRWNKAKREPLGFVLSYPLGSMPGRAGFMAFIAAGPLANLATAGVLLGIASVEGVGEWAHALAGLALIQAAPGIASLIPTDNCGYSSDGRQLLRWWRGVPDDDPSLAFMRLNGRCFAGAPAADLCERDLRILESAPLPMCFLADAWRLMIARDRGDAVEVASVSQRIETRLEALADAERAAIDDLLVLLRCEIAFCAALFSDGMRPPDPCTIPKRLHWYVPQLPHRLEAMRAAAYGDAGTCRAALADYRRHAAESFDAAEASGVPAMVASVERVLACALARREGEFTASAEVPQPSTSTTAPGVV
jgi:hypothetical protein